MTGSGTRERHFTLVGLEFLWIWGLGLLLLTPLALITLITTNQSKQLDTLAWIVIGAGVPLISALIAPRIRPTSLLARALGAAAILFVVLYLGVSLATAPTNLIGLLSGILECWLFFRVLRLRASPRTGGIGGVIVFGSIVLFAWVGGLKLIWWSDPYRWLIGSPWAIAVTLATGLLVIAAFWTDSISPMQAARSIHHRWLFGATSLVLLIGSFYPVDLSVRTIEHHWSFYVGSAQLVLDGGALLWDTPSQYGFLSILVLAGLPVTGPWIALYLLSGLANLGMALCFVGIGWLILRTFWQRVTVSLLVICVMFLRSGLADIYLGVNYYPSTGGYRFVWIALVMLIFVWGARRHGVKHFPRALLHLCSLLWVLSVLWSAESLFYTSIVFVPGFLFIVGAQENRASRAWLRRGLVPVGMLLAALIVIVGGYEFRFGHPPDLYLYFQYLLAYNAGFAFLPLDVLGPVWILFVVAVLVTSFAVAMRRFEFSLEQKFSLLILALGAIGTASYFMAARSHPNNIINISLFICMPLLLVYSLVRERMRAHYLYDLLRLVVPVVIVILIAAPLADADALDAYIHPVGLPPWHTLEQPSVDASLQVLIDRAAVMPDDRIIIMSDSMYSTVMPPWRFLGDGRLIQDSGPWLPVSPLPQIDLLPPSDRELYLDRYAVTHRVGGWLIVASRLDPPEWLRRYIDANYLAAASFQNSDWTAIRYVPAPSP